MFAWFLLTMSVIWTKEVNSWAGECGSFLNVGGWTSEQRGRGSIEGANVPQAGNAVYILHPLSLRLLAYFYSSLSETWVGSSPFPLEEFFLLLAPPSPPTATAVAAFYLFPSGYRCGDNNMQTFWYLQFECRKTGTESRDGTARGGPLNFSKTQPRLRARYSINCSDKGCRGNRYRMPTNF